MPKGLGFCPRAEGCPNAPVVGAVLPKGVEAAGVPKADVVRDLPTAKIPVVPPG